MHLGLKSYGSTTLHFRFCHPATLASETPRHNNLQPSFLPARAGLFSAVGRGDEEREEEGAGAVLIQLVAHLGDALAVAAAAVVHALA